MARLSVFALGLLIALGACSDSATTPDAGAAIDAAPVDAAPAWTEAFPAQEGGWLLNVWGPAPDDLYAVGGTPDEGRITHFDGQTWSRLDHGLDIPLLNWAHGFGPDDITIVGADGTAIHWDGATWEIQATPTDQDLWGVWGASPDDLWAVGGNGRMAGQATMLHFDGQAWTEAEVPPIQRANVYAFFKVWGTGADNVLVVGQRGVVLRYDGQTWTEELAGVGADLISLWGTGPDRIVAVGGRAAGYATVWDGSSWTPIEFAPLPGLNGVWVGADGIAHAVGVTGLVVTLDTSDLSYDNEFARLPITAQFDFHAVFSADGETLVTVGGNLLAVDPPYMGIAYQASLAGSE
ncbi:hypothetical protein [Haliangium sp.]|uniref:sialidase family protein n=1 Tax=Haliangium sp. TaxID=2663208 RepID=UPI003D0E9754